MYRLLIAFYFLIGVSYIGMAWVVGIWTLQAFAKAPNGRIDRLFEDAIIIGLMIGTSFLFLFTAYGLWKRWRLLRLVLIGLSILLLGFCAFAASVALATLAGLTDGRFLLSPREPPSETLVIALGYSAFAGLHWWILMRPAARASAVDHSKPESRIDDRVRASSKDPT